MSAKRTARSRNSSGSFLGSCHGLHPSCTEWSLRGTRGGSVPVCATASADHSAFGAGGRYRIMRHAARPFQRGASPGTSKSNAPASKVRHLGSARPRDPCPIRVEDTGCIHRLHWSRRHTRRSQEDVPNLVPRLVRASGEPALECGGGGLGACSPVRCRSSDTNNCSMSSKCAAAPCQDEGQVEAGCWPASRCWIHSKPSVVAISQDAS